MDECPAIDRRSRAARWMTSFGELERRIPVRDHDTILELDRLAWNAHGGIWSEHYQWERESPEWVDLGGSD